MANPTEPPSKLAAFCRANGMSQGDLVKALAGWSGISRSTALRLWRGGEGNGYTWRAVCRSIGWWLKRRVSLDEVM